MPEEPGRIFAGTGRADRPSGIHAGGDRRADEPGSTNDNPKIWRGIGPFNRSISRSRTLDFGCFPSRQEEEKYRSAASIKKHTGYCRKIVGRELSGDLVS